MTDEVTRIRQAAARRLALETPRAVMLDGEDLALLGVALTEYHRNGGALTFHERYDHQRQIEELADRLGVQLGTTVHSTALVERTPDQQWRDRMADESAREYHARRSAPLVVDPPADECPDCGTAVPVGGGLCDDCVNRED